MLLGCLSAACGPVRDDDTTATEPVTTGDPGTTADAPTSGPGDATNTPPDPTTSADPTTGDPTTGEPPPICPEDPPGETPQWDHVFPDIEGGPRVGGVVVAPDGRIVVAQRQIGLDGDSVGAQFFSPLGGFEQQVLFKTPWILVSVRLVRAGDRMVLFGVRRELADDAPDVGWFALLPEGGSDPVFHTFDVPEMNHPFAFVDAGGATLVAALDIESHAMFLADIDLDTGVSAWSKQMPGDALSTDMVGGPNGEVVLVRGKWGDDFPSELRAWRLGSAGEILWDSTFTPKDAGSGLFGGAAVSPDGQVVVLEQWFEPGRLFANGLDLAEGAPLWRTQIAADEPDALVRAGGVITDSGGVRVVLGQTNDSATTPLVGSVVALSLAGDLVDTRPIAVPELLGGSLLQPARGACGELYLLFPGAPGWLGAFGP